MSTVPAAVKIAGLLVEPDRRVAPDRFPRTVDEIDLPGLYAWFADETGAA